MPTPKKKMPKARTSSRRSQWKGTPPTFAECPQCHQPKRPHHLCPTCGHYRGREVEPLRTSAH